VSLWLLENLSHLFFRFMNLVSRHLVGFLGLGGQPVTNPPTCMGQHEQKTRTNLHVLRGIQTWTCDPSVQAAKTHILDRMATVNNIVYLHDENHLIIFWSYNFLCNCRMYFFLSGRIFLDFNAWRCMRMTDFIICTHPQISLGRWSQGEWSGQGMWYAWWESLKDKTTRKIKA
jgi:hypothetical protein